MGKQIRIIALFFICCSAGSTNSFAMLSPHPIQLYEKGVAILNSYRGDPFELYQSEKIFAQLIEKYPESPFGYLGISRIRIIEAYRYDNIYDMTKIRKEALPFAIKALELGSSLREVHEHYAIFERIFEQYNANQKQAQKFLTSNPEDPKTFFTVATFLHDQNEYEKALDYYKLALDMDPSSALRLKILKRIILTYLNEYNQPQAAIPYCKEAIQVGGNSLEFYEYLGRAHLNTRNYKLAIEKLSKAVKNIKTDFDEYYLFQARGYLAAEKGKNTKALQLLEKALSYRRMNLPLQYTVGNLYYKLGNYEKAYHNFQQVIELTPQGEKVYEPEAYYFAGRSAESLGYKASARDYYRRYLQLNASSQEAEWIRNNIPDLSRSESSP